MQQQSCVTCHSSPIPQIHTPHVLCKCPVLQYHYHNIASWEDGEYWHIHIAICPHTAPVLLLAVVQCLAYNTVQLCYDDVMVFVLPCYGLWLPCSLVLL